MAKQTGFSYKTEERQKCCSDTDLLAAFALGPRQHQTFKDTLKTAVCRERKKYLGFHPPTVA